jgi:hypothetical protein
MYVVSAPRVLTSLLGVAMILAACGGGSTDAGPAGSAAPAQTQVTVTAADAAKPFSLQAGRYKFTWAAPGCTGLDFTMTGATKGFVYNKKPSVANFNALVSAVPEDSYTLAQANAACTDWTVTLDRVGG